MNDLTFLKAQMQSFKTKGCRQDKLVDFSTTYFFQSEI